MLTRVCAILVYIVLALLYGMESFIALCTGRLFNDISQPDEKERRPTSPETPNTKYYDCANFSCVCYGNDKDVLKWPTASINGIMYRFCSAECWSEWAQNPSYIACWSPEKITKDQDKPIPHLDLYE